MTGPTLRDLLALTLACVRQTGRLTPLFTPEQVAELVRIRRERRRWLWHEWHVEVTA